MKRSGASEPWSVQKKVWVGLAAFVFVQILSGVSHWTQKPSAKAATATKRDCSVQGIEGQDTASALLDAWKEGSAYKQYWAPGVTPTALLAVRDYKLLNSGPLLKPTGEDMKTGNVATLLEGDKETVPYGYVFRVDSSTMGGFHITKDWLVREVAIGENCYVTGVEEYPG